MHAHHHELYPVTHSNYDLRTRDRYFHESIESMYDTCTRETIFFFTAERTLHQWNRRSFVKREAIVLPRIIRLKLFDGLVNG